MKILITRHGQTDWNIEGKIQGKTDITLNETGREQARKVREKLKNTSIDIIISSPLKRAKETAEIIKADRNIPLITQEGLTERAFGIFEGKTKEQFDFESVWNYEIEMREEGLEEIHELFERVQSFLEEVKKQYQDKTVLFVTHGGVSIPIRSYFEGMPEDLSKLIKYGLDNCEVKEYEL